MHSLQGGLGGAIEERDLTDLTPGKWASGGKKRSPDFGKFSAGPRKESIKCVKLVKSRIFPAGGPERAF